MQGLFESPRPPENNGKPASDGPPVKTPGAKPASSNGIFFGFSGTVSDEELRDLAAGFALNDKPYSTLSDAIDAQETVALESAKGPFLLEERRIQQTKETLANREADERTRLATAESQLSKLQEGLVEAKAKLGLTEANRKNFEYRVHQARLAHIRKMFEGHAEELGKAPAALFEEWKAAFAKAREVHADWVGAWEKDKGEFERRASHYDSELEAIQKQSDRANAQLGFLKGIGLTRTVAGFLVWGGYLWLAGNSILVARVFSRATDATADFLSALVDPLSKWINSLPMLQALLYYLVAVVACLAAIAAVTIGVDYLLSLVYGRTWAFWNQRAGPPKTLSLSKVVADVRGLFQEEAVQEEGTKSKGKRNTEPTTRWTFLQLIAAIPSIFLTSLFVFVLAAAGAAATSATTRPDLTVVYLSLVWSVATAASALLYTCHVILVRWHRLEYDAAQMSSLPWLRRISINWEYILLAVGFTGSAIAFGWQWQVQGTVPRVMVWGPVLFSFGLGSLTLAYGLVLRGLFREQKYLQDQKQVYQTLKDSALAKPCLTDLVNVDRLRQTGQSLEEMAVTRHRLQELRLLRDIEKQYDLDAEKGGAAEGLINSVAKWLGLSIRVKVPWRRSSASTEDILRNVEMPELMTDWDALNAAHSEASMKVEGIQGEIEYTKKTVEDLEKSGAKLREEQKKVDDEHVFLLKRHQAELRELVNTFARARWVSLSAYEIGLRCREAPEPKGPDDGPGAQAVPKPPEPPDAPAGEAGAEPKAMSQTAGK